MMQENTSNLGSNCWLIFCREVEESKLIFYLIFVWPFKRLFWPSFKSSEYYVEFFLDLLEYLM